MGRSKTISDEDVLQTARLAFLSEGHAASTRVIAERVGLSQAALVQRFGTKGALFLAAIQPDVLDVEVILGNGDEALRHGALNHLAGIAARLLSRVEQQVPCLLHLRQNPAIAPKAVERAHARLGVPALVQQLGERIKWLQERRLLSEEASADQLVDVVLTLVHGLAFMNLVGGHTHQDARSRFRKLLAGIIPAPSSGSRPRIGRPGSRGK